MVGNLVFAAAGCAKARAAETVPDGPPLSVPAPPPRVLAPVELPAVAATAPPAEVPAAASRPAPRPPAPRANEPAPRQEPAPPPVVAERPPSPEPARPVTLTSAEAAQDRKVRDILTRSARDLNRVDYRRLSAEGKSQYDQAKRFEDQAEQALKERNFVFAETLADKAATLAAELLRR